MFTGIIQITGKVKKRTDRQITVETPEIVRQLKKGGSIAVDGACLTVTGLSDKTFTADFMPETAKKTIIGNCKKGQSVNLEFPLRADGRWEGHIMMGHVDGVGKIISAEADGNAFVLSVKVPSALSRYIVQKGSVAINGISLTVMDLADDQLKISIIPHTWEMTNLHELSVGDKVNVETDVLGKYVEKFCRGAKFCAPTKFISN